jgi:hypothetical protein
MARDRRTANEGRLLMSSEVVRNATLGRPDIFGLIIYVPNPLAGFLDGLRKDLVPGCNPRAHLTVLPPGGLDCDISPTINRSLADP